MRQNIADLRRWTRFPIMVSRPLFDGAKTLGSDNATAGRGLLVVAHTLFLTQSAIVS